MILELHAHDPPEKEPIGEGSPSSEPTSEGIPQK